MIDRAQLPPEQMRVICGDETCCSDEIVKLENNVNPACFAVPNWAAVRITCMIPLAGSVLGSWDEHGDYDSSLAGDHYLRLALSFPKRAEFRGERRFYMTWSQPLSAENLIIRTHGQMGETEAQRGNRFTQWVGLELRLRSLVTWTLSPSCG